MSKLEIAARQALDWIDANAPRYVFEAVEKALAEQAEQEPVAEVVLRNQTVGFGRTEERKDVMFLADVDVGTKLYAKSQQKAEQEPVAWGYFDADGSFMDALDRQHGAYQTPLYAAPVRTKDLTDDEIEKAYWSSEIHGRIDGIRAVIAADREKNK